MKEGKETITFGRNEGRQKNQLPLEEVEGKQKRRLEIEGKEKRQLPLEGNKNDNGRNYSFRKKLKCCEMAFLSTYVRII